MRTVPLLASLCALGLAAPAMAQNSSSSASTSTPSTAAPTNTATTNTTMPPGTLQKDVASDLQKAGFTDIHVMPSSFLVRAKDKSGRPVMMVINPDSVTEITNMGTPASTAHK